jgi:hypothetical protein
MMEGINGLHKILFKTLSVLILLALRLIAPLHDFASMPVVKKPVLELLSNYRWLVFSGRSEHELRLWQQPRRARELLQRCRCYLHTHANNLSVMISPYFNENGHRPAR